MGRFSEMPASPKRGNEVARHMSEKQRGRGLMITRQGGNLDVWNIDRIFHDHLTAYMFDLVDTEPEARTIANREWVGTAL
ncbi:hypothetical protein [Streptomyces sp. NPDC058612]|uniref:hypothetical protein n=1 Tax=Streptomyces sp. NPDC058612 TaxID=3346555 RepID=UPI003665771E